MKIIQSVVAGLSPHAKAIVAGMYTTSQRETGDAAAVEKESGKHSLDLTPGLPAEQRPALANGERGVKKEYKKHLEKLRQKAVDDRVFEFRKVTLMAEMLLRHGLEQEGTDLIKRLVVISDELELFAERSHLFVIADLYKVKLESIYASKKYRDEIADDLRVYQQSIAVAEVFTSGQYLVLTPLELQKHERGIELLKRNYESSGRFRMGYLFHYSCLCFAMANDGYKQAIFHGELLLDMVHKKTRIFSVINHAELLRLLAIAWLGRNDLQKALVKSYEAVKTAPKHSAAQAYSLEVLFCVLFHAKQFSDLPDVVSKVKRNVYLKRDRICAARWKLLQASMHFKKGNYTDALRQLKDACCFPREAGEWVIYSQLLEAMCRVELGQHEWFPIRAEALRKCIYRYENKNRHKRNGRLVLMYRLLKELHYNNLDYNLLVEEEHDALELLASSEGNFYCHPTGPELVRFEEWIQLKARKQGINRKGKRLVT